MKILTYDVNNALSFRVSVFSLIAFLSMILNGGDGVTTFWPPVPCLQALTYRNHMGMAILECVPRLWEHSLEQHLQNLKSNFYRPIY